jgi:hypothetical protein
MDARSFDGVAKRMATIAPRRRILQGLGALGVGSLGVLGLAEGGSAQDVGDETHQPRRCRRCIRRCDRDCENRRPRCLERCFDRRCEDLCA